MKNFNLPKRKTRIATTAKNGLKQKAAGKSSGGSHSEEWLVCKPLMDELMATVNRAHQLAVKSEYKRGTSIVNLCSETIFVFLNLHHSR